MMVEALLGGLCRHTAQHVRFLGPTVEATSRLNVHPDSFE
jgi:hypothetical protein